MALTKRFAFDRPEYGITVYGMIVRESDQYILDYTDGSFGATPDNPYCPFTAHAVILGRYSFEESREIWQDGYYTVIAYKQVGASPSPSSDTIIGTGSMYLRGDASVIAPSGRAATTLSMLLTRWRNYLDDTVQPYAWSNVELVDYANNVVDVLCRESWANFDTQTAQCCSYTLSADTQEYSLDPSVLRVTRARLDGQALPLTIKSDADMHKTNPNWDVQTQTSTPTFMITPGLGPSRFAVYPTPDDTYTLNLAVYRLPIAILSASDLGGTPDIPEQHVRFMDHGVYARAYGKNDHDTDMQKKAEKHMQLFMADKERLRRAILAEDHREFRVSFPTGLPL